MTSHVMDINAIIDPKEAEPCCRSLLKLIRPQWISEDVKFVLFTEGISNKLYGCYTSQNCDDNINNNNDVVVIRIYGENSDLVIDREAEFRNMQVLHSAGCGPQLYCRFTNGLAYEFVPGVCLDENTVRDPLIRALIAEEMACLHKISLTNYSRSQNVISGETERRQPMLFTKMHQWMKLVPNSFTDPEKHQRFLAGIPSKASLNAEIELLESRLRDLDSPIVFCHNDLLLKNIIYNEVKGTVTFIDYEYANYNYAAFDIADHFCEYAGVENVDFSKYPDRAYQEEWLRVYLAAKHQCKPLKVPQGEVNDLYKQVRRFSAASHFFWALWGLIQSYISAIDFDYLQYSIVKFEEYFKRKDEYLFS